MGEYVCVRLCMDAMWMNVPKIGSYVWNRRAIVVGIVF